VKRQSAGVSARLTADEQAMLEVLDFSFSELVHQILDNLSIISKPEDIKEALIKFDDRQRHERELFKATLETHYKGQIIGGIRYSKRQKAIREIHTALESVLGPPPWDCISYRERINDNHLGTLVDVKISPEELEGYSKIRGFISANILDTTEYLPTFSESVTEDSSSKVCKKARESLERQIRGIIKSKPKDDLETVLDGLLSNPSWNEMANKADVDLKDLWTKIVTTNTGMISDE